MLQPFLSRTSSNTSDLYQFYPGSENHKTIPPETLNLRQTNSAMLYLCNFLPLDHVGNVSPEYRARINELNNDDSLVKRLHVIEGEPIVRELAIRAFIAIKARKGAYVSGAVFGAVVGSGIACSNTSITGPKTAILIIAATILGILNIALADFFSNLYGNNLRRKMDLPMQSYCCIGDKIT